MGRYAFFNTTLEYKFWFGSQPSEDIEKFGGWIKYINDGERKIRWTQEDTTEVLKKVRQLETSLGLEPCDFAKFEKSLDGTHELRDELDIADSSLYLIGALIYHQLLYKEILEAEYEL